MSKPTVRAVYRVTLDTDRYGQITARALIGAGQVCPDGAAVVLDCGTGYWINSCDLEHIRKAFSNVSHISVTAALQQEHRGGNGHFGTIFGIGAIADRLGELIAAPPLFESA